MKKTVDGLILRETAYGESDKLLTVLTAEQGQITMIAKGARSMKSHVLTVCRLFNYVNLEYYEKYDRRWISGGSVNAGFFGLFSDLEASALGSYVAEVACEITGEDVPAPEILQMTLNTLYAIQQGRHPRAQIKAVYELFAAAVSGFSPDLSACGGCSAEEQGALWLDVMNGRLLCEDCMRRQPSAGEGESVDEYSVRTILLPLDPSALSSMRYVLSAPMRRIFSFRLTDPESLACFGRATEVYLLNHLERSFDTLDFYKKVIV